MKRAPIQSQVKRFKGILFGGREKQNPAMTSWQRRRSNMGDHHQHTHFNLTTLYIKYKLYMKPLIKCLQIPF